MFQFISQTGSYLFALLVKYFLNSTQTTHSSQQLIDSQPSADGETQKLNSTTQNTISAIQTKNLLEEKRKSKNYKVKISKKQKKDVRTTSALSFFTQGLENNSNNKTMNNDLMEPSDDINNNNLNKIDDKSIENNKLDKKATKTLINNSSIRNQNDNLSTNHNDKLVDNENNNLTINQKDIIISNQNDITSNSPIENKKINQLIFLKSTFDESNYFNKANEIYLQLLEDMEKVKELNFKRIPLNLRRRIYLHCLGLLEQLKNSLNKINKEGICQIDSCLYTHIVELRNIVAKRNDCFLATKNKLLLDGFISKDKNCILNLILDSYNQVNLFFINHGINSNFNPFILTTNSIYQEIYLSGSGFELPKQKKEGYILKILDLIENDLPAILKNIDNPQQLNNHPNAKTNLITLFIQLGTYALTLRNHYPTFCAEKTGLFNLSLLNGMLLVTLDVLKNNELKLIEILEGWKPNHVLATCINIRNVYCHPETDENSNIKEVDAIVLFHLAERLESASNDLKNVLNALTNENNNGNKATSFRKK